jgi:hypothetical protein
MRISVFLLGALCELRVDDARELVRRGAAIDGTRALAA